LNPYARFLGSRDPLKVAASTASRIARLIYGLSLRQLTLRPSPDKWSVQEIITHLAETEMVMCCRARWIAFEEQPTLVPFDQEKWSRGWHREKESVEEILERFRLLRRSQMRLFRSVSGNEWDRTGFHPERGILSLKTQLETLAGHDLNHLEQIHMLAAKLRSRHS
jgi:hypothetical protein